MSKTRWATALLLIGAVALFVPLVPQTQASGQFLGAHYQRTAVVSPTYYVFHCGAFVNSQISAQLASGYSGFYQLSKGYNFACNYSSQ
jgi:hypothetical protein